LLVTISFTIFPAFSNASPYISEFTTEANRGEPNAQYMLGKLYQADGSRIAAKKASLWFLRASQKKSRQSSI
jgi:TPR repeat protein